jgi:hypothetical protein
MDDKYYLALPDMLYVARKFKVDPNQRAAALAEKRARTKAKKDGTWEQEFEKLKEQRTKLMKGICEEYQVSFEKFQKSTEGKSLLGCLEAELDQKKERFVTEIVRTKQALLQQEEAKRKREKEKEEKAKRAKPSSKKDNKKSKK